MMRERLFARATTSSGQFRSHGVKGARKLPGSGGASEKMLARHRQAGTPVPLLKKERA